MISPQHSKTIGDTTEPRVISELTARGYRLAVPFGDSAKYDLVVDNHGTLRFNTPSQTTLDGDYHETTYHGDTVAFVIRYPETERLFWIDVDGSTDQKMDLRYEAKIDHPAINWAGDFELGDEIPT